MRLIKIRNKYLFNSNNPNGTHTYAVFYDRKEKEYRAVQITHIYVPDEKRQEQLKKGLLKKVKFNQYEVPSGVKNNYFAANINGNKISLKDPDIVKVDKNHLPKKISEDIKHFAKKRNK